MKRIFRMLVGLIVLLVVLAVGLQLYLQHGLTATLQQVVLPKLKEEQGIDVSVGELSLNLFRGRLHLTDVAVKNPDGFVLENILSVKRFETQLDVLELLKSRRIVVRNVALEKALVNVVRNKDGELNIQRFVPEKEEEAPGDEEPNPEEKEPLELPEIWVKSTHFATTVRYLDLSMSNLDLELEMVLDGRDLSTVREPDFCWGHAELEGALREDRGAFLTSIKLDTAPLVDLRKASFDLVGTVLEIDPRIVALMYDKMGIRTDPFGLGLNISCRDGVFQHSNVMLAMNNIIFEDKLKRRLGGVGSIASLKFPVPIEGTLEKPRVNAQQALIAAIGGNATSLIGSFLKGLQSKDEPEPTAGNKNEPKGLAEEPSSDTKTPSSADTDELIDRLGKEVDEVGENEELKNALKGLGRALFE